MSRIATIKDIGKTLKDILISTNEYYTYDEASLSAEEREELKKARAQSEKAIKSYERKYSGQPNNGGTRRKKGSLEVQTVKTDQVKSKKGPRLRETGEIERE